MKAHLLYRDRDIDLGAPLPWNAKAIVKDLDLETILLAMAEYDELVYKVAWTLILTGAQNDCETIRYRQDVLRDCLDHPAVVREIYAIATEAMEQEKKHYLGILARYPDTVLRYSIQLMAMFLDMVLKLRKLADRNIRDFKSDGWTAFFETLRSELSDDYIANVRRHLVQLKLRDGVLFSAELGRGNKGVLQVMHQPPRRSKISWLRQIMLRLTSGRDRPEPEHGFSIHPRDEGGIRALSALRNRSISIAADALAQSAEHVRSYFNMLRMEMAFYVGCVNLHERLLGKGEPTCIPVPSPFAERRHSFRGLYDVSLSLNMNGRVMGNDADMNGKDLTIITGANQGGKSTFLRSLGLAQLMAQSGMFVSADAFYFCVGYELMTHFKREEDASMKSGKLDEELGRMSDLVDHATRQSMILFNESFAATNDREGSEIARQITAALLEARIKMVFVTHLYEFAHDVYQKNAGKVLFLRAPRRNDGTRTFKLREGQPLRTSFGEDLYGSIFGNDDDGDDWGNDVPVPNDVAAH